MQTSKQGVEFIERHEGVVLKAYRDPVGIWTIGAGLTKASGVVVPRAGMVITRKEASRLLARALSKYERAVEGAMPGAVQREFDGGVSFHYNTGAIGRASWVRSWIARNWPEVERRLGLWCKGGGKVLPGLARRRREEFELIRWGDYREESSHRAIERVKVVVSIDPETFTAIKKELARLGYRWTPGGISAFQRDHDLTQDGIVGRATLATLQRRLDAREKAKVGATGAAAGTGGTLALSDLPSWAPVAALVVIALLAARFAFQYRDVVAAKTHKRAPGLARKLRSF